MAAITPFKTGSDLLNSWHCESREDKLERACSALMSILEDIHTSHRGQSLKANVTNPAIYCSCADAYRMGHEALKLHPKREIP